MRDVFKTKKKRSEVMSKIRSKYTKLDKTMEALLEKNGLEFEMYPSLEGHPDFLVKPNIVVFCDSSFWHGRNWKKLRTKLLKSSNPDYWIEHISGNIRRDKVVTKNLARSGYKVLRFWDTEIFKDAKGCVKRIKQTQ